jgi:hypothetical protein
MGQAMQVARGVWGGGPRRFFFSLSVSLRFGLICRRAPFLGQTVDPLTHFS